jgi:hypothetical protein
MDGKQIGVVLNFVDRLSVAVVKLSDSLVLGDTLRFVGGESDFTEVVDSIELHGKNVSEARKGDEVMIKVSEKVKYSYRVYLV